MLDDSLRPAMVHLTAGLAGDELALEALRENVERQANLVEELTKQVAKKTALSESAFQELKSLVRFARTPDDAQKMKDIGLAMALGPLGLLFGGGGDGEAQEKREEIAKLALERADQASQQVSAKLTSEVTALETAIDKYTSALQDHFDHQVAISRLRIHVKQNIIYYMQVIWDHEPTDQRYFRLYNIEVPWIELREMSLTVEGRGARPGGFAPGGRHEYEFEFETSVPLLTREGAPVPVHVRTTRRLSEVADLDNLLGYKGNYMIFPAREASYLHLYMMQDYVDPGSGGLRDPSEPAGGVTSRELLDYVCCLRRYDPAEFEKQRDHLRDLVRERMASPNRESETIVVPTDSLYIEALPGSHPVIEPFKRVHRALDVKKVQAEVRHAELENLRLVARMLDGDFGDPDVEKLVRVEGTENVEVDT
jgi:hypothetical protein